MAWWILQSNPARIDIDTYLRLREVPTLWGARRYADRIAVGDRAFLWRAKGGTRVEPGIVGLATVVEPAFPRPHVHPELFRDPTQNPPKLRVGLRVDELRLMPDEGMIPRQDVKTLPEMRGHLIVTSNVGSDFALSEAQARALLALWVGS